jgi:hypothetical protein
VLKSPQLSEGRLRNKKLETVFHLQVVEVSQQQLAYHMDIYMQLHEHHEVFAQAELQCNQDLLV